jgi:hypothetical protein
MPENERKRPLWVPVVVIAAAVLLVALAVYLVTSRKSPVQATEPRQAVAPPRVEALPAAETAPAVDTSPEVPAGGVGELVKEKAKEASATLARRRTELSAEDIQKLHGIADRMRANFAKIQTIKYRLTETRETLPSDSSSAPPSDASQEDKGLFSDVRAEFTREPLYIRLVGTSGREPIDTTITPKGKVDAAKTTGPAERAISKMTDNGMPEAIERMLDPEEPVSFKENQGLDADLLDLAAAKGIALSADARYDVVKTKEGGQTDETWVNRDTGMIDVQLSRRDSPAPGENPVRSIDVVEWGKAGDVYYFKSWDSWLCWDFSAWKETPDFTWRAGAKTSEVEVNGVKGQ